MEVKFSAVGDLGLDCLGAERGPVYVSSAEDLDVVASGDTVYHSESNMYVEKRKPKTFARSAKRLLQDVGDRASEPIAAADPAELGQREVGQVGGISNIISSTDQERSERRSLTCARYPIHIAVVGSTRQHK